MENDYNYFRSKVNPAEWQAMRTEVFNRDGQKCVLCELDKDVLNPHHLTYDEILNPENVVTLCQHHHNQLHSVAKEIIKENNRLCSECKSKQKNLEDEAKIKLDAFIKKSCKNFYFQLYKESINNNTAQISKYHDLRKKQYFIYIINKCIEYHKKQYEDLNKCVFPFSGSCAVLDLDKSLTYARIKAYSTLKEKGTPDQEIMKRLGMSYSTFKNFKDKYI